MFCTSLVAINLEQCHQLNPLETQFNIVGPHTHLQESKGIRQWPINCCTSLMMIMHKITLSVDYNLWLKHLDTQFMNLPIKIQYSPNVVRPKNKINFEDQGNHQHILGAPNNKGEQRRQNIKSKQRNQKDKIFFKYFA